MGRLKDIITFLENTRTSIVQVTNKLNKIQSFYNDNFIHANKIRENEIQFLQSNFFRNAKNFPPEINSNYKNELKNQEKIFNDNLKKLLTDKKKIEKEFNECNKERKILLNDSQNKNIGLDSKEEKLKKDINIYESKIKNYNLKIDELNNGFGFIANFFKMRKIQKSKKALIDERNILIERIETIRNQWTTEHAELANREEKLQTKWNNLQVDQSMISEKISNLETNKNNIIKKAAFMTVISSLEGSENFLTQKLDYKKYDKCPRCNQKNIDNKFFCCHCGERFTDDRKDIMGSLVEVGELNRIFNILKTGMGESVSIIALMKGIKDGISTFIKSVNKVKQSQDKYPSLPTLQINIPAESKSFSEKFNELSNDIDIEYHNYRPGEFAEKFKTFIEKNFSTKNIEVFFKKMGDELNRTTKRQWK